MQKRYSYGVYDDGSGLTVGLVVEGDPLTVTLRTLDGETVIAPRSNCVTRNGTKHNIMAAHLVAKGAS